jgi:DNA topoisomerase-1
MAGIIPNEKRLHNQTFLKLSANFPTTSPQAARLLGCVVQKIFAAFRNCPLTDAKTARELPSDLHYVDDTQPGLRRKVLRGHFAYFTPEGERIRDPEQIKRINQLVIPPAYKDVWICADPLGHLQATGRDARGRKQYRYHPRWRELRDESKYARMMAFGKVLPSLRKQLDAHLATPGLNHDKVMATVISLLDATLIRVGNAQYARDNKSYGLTTLRSRHVEVHGSQIAFAFRGKSGVEHQVSVKDRRLANIVKRCMELPGQHLFQYLDDDGQRRHVNSSDVNAYLQQLTGADFTAKDYRTWAGTALALDMLRELHWQPEPEAKRHIVEMVKAVARQLGNTPAVCRRCYIHPAVLEHFALGELAKLPKPRQRKGLRLEEVALASFLEKLTQLV